MRPRPLPLLTVTARFDQVDALRCLDSALSAVGPITELTLTERDQTRTSDKAGEAEQQTSGCCGDGGFTADAVERVSRRYPVSWTLNESIRQLIDIRRRRRRPEQRRKGWALLQRAGARSRPATSHTQRLHQSDSTRRSYPLTKLTLCHRADHLPLTIQSMSALCFLLPTLQELHILTEEMPSGGEAASYLLGMGYCEALLRPVSQLQLRALSLPSWASVDGMRAVFDFLGHYADGCCKKEMTWSDLHAESPFPLTPCGRSLRAFAWGSASTRGFKALTADVVLLCSQLPQLTSLSLTNFFVLDNAVAQVRQLPRLKSLHLISSQAPFDSLSDHILPHLPSLTELDLGLVPLGIRLRGVGDIARLVTCCPQLTSLSNVTLWRHLCRDLRPLVGLTQLTVNCRRISRPHHEDIDTLRPFMSVLPTELRQLADLSALTSLTIRCLPAADFRVLMCIPLPALRSLEVHIDFLTYKKDVWEMTCRGEVAAKSAAYQRVDGEGAHCLQRPATERSTIIGPYVHSSQRPPLLSSVTRLHFCSPRLQPELIHLLALCPALHDLTLEQHQPLPWESWDTARVHELAQLSLDPLHSLQDVDLLHLAALPALHRLELRGLRSLTARVLAVLACVDGVRALVLRGCDGVDVAEVAELVELAEGEGSGGDGEQHGAMGVGADGQHVVSADVDDGRQPPPSARQTLDVLRLNDCLRAPASWTARVRHQMGRWSAAKRVGAEQSLSHGESGVRSAGLTVREFTLSTRQWRMGVQVERAQSTLMEVGSVESDRQPIRPSAFISLHLPPSDEPLPRGSSHPPAMVAETWRDSRRYPGAAEVVWLWCGLVSALLYRWCVLPCKTRLKPTTLAWVFILKLILVLVAWATIPGVVVGLCLDSSAPNSSAVAFIVMAFTWPPVAYLDIVIAKRKFWLGQSFNYQSRLARRREMGDGEIEGGGMDEGGMWTGWTSRSFSAAALFWLCHVLNSVACMYNLAYFGIVVARKGSPSDNGGNEPNSTLPLSSSSTGVTLLWSR